MERNHAEQLEQVGKWFDTHLRGPCFHVANRAATRLLASIDLSGFTRDTTLLLAIHRSLLTSACLVKSGSNPDLAHMLATAQNLDAAAFVNRAAGSHAALLAADACLLSADIWRQNDFQRQARRSVRVALDAMEGRSELEIGAFFASIFEDMEAETKPRTTSTVFEGRPLDKIGDWLMYFGSPPRGGVAERFGAQLDSAFWARWWEGIFSGDAVDWALQERVALIPDGIWQQGAAAVAEEIRRIEAEFDRAPQTLDDALAKMPPGSQESLANFSRSAWKHREELPATLDAILGYCQLEIERLQGKNFQTDDERDEAKRQIAVLETLHSAIERLAPLIKTDSPLNEAQAVMPEKLTRIAMTAFKNSIPKTMEGAAARVFPGALFGATACAAIYLGVPATVAIAAGAYVFGGKEIADAIKAGSDSKGL